MGLRARLLKRVHTGTMPRQPTCPSCNAVCHIVLVSCLLVSVLNNLWCAPFPQSVRIASLLSRTLMLLLETSIYLLSKTAPATVSIKQIQGAVTTPKNVPAEQQAACRLMFQAPELCCTAASAKGGLAPPHQAVCKLRQRISTLGSRSAVYFACGCDAMKSMASCERVHQGAAELLCLRRKLIRLPRARAHT